MLIVFKQQILVNLFLPNVPLRQPLSVPLYTKKSLVCIVFKEDQKETFVA